MILPDQEWDVPESDLATRTVAAAVLPEEGDTTGRMIVVGDASFAETQFVQGEPRQSPLPRPTPSTGWRRRRPLINIRSKDRTPPPLTFESDAARNLLKWGNLVGVPLLFSLLGVARVTGRRRRAEAIWKEVVA